MTHNQRVEALLLIQARYLSVIAQAAVDANIYREQQSGCTYNPGNSLLDMINSVDVVTNHIGAEIGMEQATSENTKKECYDHYTRPDQGSETTA